MREHIYTRRTLLVGGLAAGFAASVAGAFASSPPAAPERVAALTVPPPTPLPMNALRLWLPFAAGFAVVQRTVPGGFAYGYIDKTGAVVIPTQFEQARDFSPVGLAPVKVGSKHGYINTSGDFVIPPRYADALPFGDNGLAAVWDGQGLGFVNTAGDEVIPPQFAFDGTTQFGAYPATGQPPLPPLPPLAVVKRRDGKQTYIDPSGAEVFAAPFDQAVRFSSEGFAAVKVGKAWGYIDRSGAFAVPPQYRQVGSIVNEGVATYSVDYGRDGLLHVPTNTPLTPPLDYILSGTVRDDRVRAIRDDTTVYLDHTGAVAIPGPFGSGAEFAEGIATVSDQRGSYFIAPDGTPLFKRTFTRAWGFSDGLAQFAGGDRTGFLDHTGAIVIPAQFFY